MFFLGTTGAREEPVTAFEETLAVVSTVVENLVFIQI